METGQKEKVIIVGAGPVGSLAALYAAVRGNQVEVYELRGGKRVILLSYHLLIASSFAVSE
jgi:thioredoxin reductase